MDAQTALQGLPFSLPSPAYLAGAVLFGLIGMAAFAYARRTQKPRIKWISVVLMFYPYLVSSTWLLYGIGTLLCAALFVSRD